MRQVDLDCLSDAYRSEQRDYYLNTSAWAEVHPAQLLGPGTLIKSYDLNKVTLDELKVGEGEGNVVSFFRSSSQSAACKCLLQQAIRVNGRLLCAGSRYPSMYHLNLGLSIRCMCLCCAG